MLIPPQADLPATSLADWLELHTLTTEYKECAVDKLWEAMDLPDDGFPSDETEDVERENLLGRVYREFERRTETLKNAYPFEVLEGGAFLEHKKELNPGMLAYNLSLRISIKSTGIVADGSLPEISPKERNLFQSCANLAAAGYLGGRVYSFGWPRPDRTNLLNALQFVENEMGEGIVRDRPPPEAPKSAKDDELDVFAWLPHCDGPGWALTLWGQVASGKDWVNKPLSRDKIEQFRRRWYKKPPVLRPIRAMFVPFCLFGEALEKGVETYKATLLDSTVLYGIIFHRCRLPRYVQKAFDSSCEVEGTGVDNKEKIFSELNEWGSRFYETLFKAVKTETYSDLPDHRVVGRGYIPALPLRNGE